MPAGFLLRFKAFLIDYVLILAYGVVLFAVNVFIFPSLQNFFAGSVITAQLTGFLMVTLPVSLYFMLGDSVFGGQSYGKKKVGIRVVDENGAVISFFRAAIRTIIKFMPWELSHFLIYRLVDLGDAPVPISYSIIGGVIYVLIFAYILTAVFTKKKQSVYDLVAGTMVVRSEI